MRKKDAIIYAQRMSRLLGVLSLSALALLVASQYLLLSSASPSPLSRLSQIEGQELAAGAREELAAGTGRDKVYEVRLSAGGDQESMLRVYVNDHLVTTLAAGESKPVALEAGQRLAVDGQLACSEVTVTLEQEGPPQTVVIAPGAWQELSWENIP